MLRHRTLILLFLITISIPSFSQELAWKVGYNYFFDNAEYSGSSFAQSQTLHGMNLMSEIGLKVDESQSIFAGINLLKTVGNQSFTNGKNFLAYYQYKNSNVLFKAGAFPKEDMLDNYSTFFFKDSVRYFRPVMQGLFVKLTNDNKDFVNVWLDWTGHCSKSVRESFFIGASGLKNKGVFFGEMQSYLFHRANTIPSTESFNVNEQFQMQLSVGAAHSNQTGLDTLLFSVGGLVGLERDRGVSKDFYKPIGLTMRFNAEYNGLGTDNIAYFGDKRMNFYDRHKDNLYWGTPFLRGKTYIDSKWYIQLIRSAKTNANIGLHMLFSEKKMLFQQTITLSVNINNQRRPQQHSQNIFPWMKFFKK